MQFKFKMVSGWVNLQWWWHAVIALIIGRISQKMSIGPLSCTVQNGEGKLCWCCDVALLGTSVGPTWSWSSPSRRDGMNALVVEICLSLCGLCCFFLSSYCDSKFCLNHHLLLLRDWEHHPQASLWVPQPWIPLHACSIHGEFQSPAGPGSEHPDWAVSTVHCREVGLDGL